MSESWKQENPDEAEKPKFGRKGLAWFRRRAFSELFAETHAVEYPYRATQENVAYDHRAALRVIDWYADRFMRYVRWTDADTFHGSKFSDGAWTLDAEALKASWKTAVIETDQAYDAEKFTTLDEWLRADIADRLWYAGAPSGMLRVDPSKKAPRKVKCPCGERFTARRRDAVRCEKCCDRARTEREAARVPRRERNV